MSKKLYFNGPGVIGFGKNCVKRGDEIPSWLSEKRVEYFIGKGMISKNPIISVKKEAKVKDASNKIHEGS